MKKKWIIAVCAVVALGALVSTAVAHRGERMRDGRGMQAMMQELDLNAEQREQLKELRQTLREQMRDARDNGQEAMETVREVRRQALGKILNAQQMEQMAQMEQMGVTRPDFGKDFRGGKMGGYRGQWARGPRHGAKNAFAKLDLTKVQKDELKDLRQAHREEADKLRQAHQKSLEKVLTKDQHKQLEQLKDEVFYGGKRPHRRRMW